MDIKEREETRYTLLTEKLMYTWYIDIQPHTYSTWGPVDISNV